MSATTASSNKALELSGGLPQGVDPVPLERLAARLLAHLDRHGSRFGLRFACDRTVRRYNREYRGVDRPTDVLSFGLDDEIDGRVHLGDLLISRERVRVQARRNGLSPARETAELMIHGVLHLLGHDHSRDDGEMDDLEFQLRRELIDGGAGVVR